MFSRIRILKKFPTNGKIFIKLYVEFPAHYARFLNFSSDIVYVYINICIYVL
nr:MAG TPA: hypothetical protein [Caudoviricetes sp.]